MTVNIDIDTPYQEMLSELRERGESDPDADLKRLGENAIHDGYQQLNNDR
jgi:hypothetical protein